MAMPVCEGCGKSGKGVEFRICGPFEFGKYCAPCEDEIENLMNGTVASRATSSREPDMTVAPCEVCGKDVEGAGPGGCECVECPTCEVVGDPACEVNRNQMLRFAEKMESLLHLEKLLAQGREAIREDK